MEVYLDLHSQRSRYDCIDIFKNALEGQFRTATHFFREKEIAKPKGWARKYGCSCLCQSSLSYYLMSLLQSSKGAEKVNCDGCDDRTIIIMWLEG